MDNIFESYNTQLPLLQEIGYNLMKSNSPYAKDSGYDYDYRGYYNQFGNLDPTVSGHLIDKYKKPNHPTFSVESMYYNGQPYAIDWNSEPYRTLSGLGIL